MKQLAVIFFLVLFGSCKSSVPEGILPPGKMQAVYWDLMRADEMVNYYAILDTAYGRTRHQDSFYAAILGIHQISHETFLKSKYYYETHPEKLKPVLDSIHSRGEKLVNGIDLPERPDTMKILPRQRTDTPPVKTLQPDTTKRRKGLILEKAN